MFLAAKWCSEASLVNGGCSAGGRFEATGYRRK